ncbi:hypothetical protein [Aureimonas sp. SA4125]|nr:hypothetical protein [Aureimonas sp. SA4125]
MHFEASRLIEEDRRPARAGAAMADGACRETQSIRGADDGT